MKKRTALRNLVLWARANESGLRELAAFPEKLVIDGEHELAALRKRPTAGAPPKLKPRDVRRIGKAVGTLAAIAEKEGISTASVVRCRRAVRASGK